MKDRRTLQEELNRLNELYQEKDLEMRKIGGTVEDRQRMRDMLNTKKQQLVSEMGDDLQRLNIGESIPVNSGTISGPSKVMDQASLPDSAKTANIGKFGNLSRKIAGVIPLAGVGMAALSGDPAMAAEELAGDIPVAGQVYEAIKPSESGNVEEEMQMLAEDKARKNYQNSPAAADARRAALLKLGSD